MDDKELFIRHCPCCGGQAYMLINRMGESGCLYIECSDCGLGTPEMLYDLQPPAPGQLPRPYTEARRDAITLWNRRTVLQPVETPRRRRCAQLEVSQRLN